MKTLLLPLLLCVTIDPSYANDNKVKKKLGRFFGSFSTKHAALDHFQQAAEKGNNEAAVKLGKAYFLGGTLSLRSAESIYHANVVVRVEQDYPQAAKWFLMAAERNYQPKRGHHRHMSDLHANTQAEAQFLLGTMYYEGKGLPQDDYAAMQWFRKAADLDHSGDLKNHFAIRAQFRLGTFYLQEDKKDRQEAMQWFRKAAEHGHAEAQFKLGTLYAEGDKTNGNRAMRWFRKAAVQGQIDAQVVLSLMYFRGQGVRQDLTQGQHWLNRAAAQGHKVAAAFRDVLAQLSPAQRRGVRAIAGTFHTAEDFRHFDPDRLAQDIKALAEQIQAAPSLRIDTPRATQTASRPNSKQNWAAERARFERAAMHGDPEAQYRLGILYRDATPSPGNRASNRIKAYAWLVLAAETAQRRPAYQHRFNTYAIARNELAAKMQPFEIPPGP